MVSPLRRAARVQCRTRESAANMALMKRLLAFAIVAAVMFPLMGSAAPQPYGVEEPAPLDCCKTCSKGKACGDSCIAREKECHKAPGCACDG